MRSSSGEHFIALDHVRALAAFMVFAWHFTHAPNGYPVPFEYVPALFPFSLLAEGHTGVALFMTLSGYLFAKLLDGKSIDYKAFLWNRALRLFPLLVVVILIVGIIRFISGGSMYSYMYSIARGAFYPSLPNGGWSITVEFHYYAILPLFLWMLRKSKLLPISIIVAAIALRLFVHHETGEIQSLAYWTIVGRIDQFALGMLMYQFRTSLAHRHVLTIAIFTVFAMFYWYFDLRGGFYQNPSYPSPSPLWIVLPTIEGIAYAIGIAWYDSSFSHSTTGFSRLIGRIGEFSFSIYLLHFFVVFDAARFVNEHVMDISNFYVACLWSLVFFLLMMPIGYLSFRFIEAPFLKQRKRYIVGCSQETLSQTAYQGGPADELKRVAGL
jgi:peptidoglycan/LPS O-acetylase OafA/YrhL